MHPQNVSTSSVNMRDLVTTLLDFHAKQRLTVPTDGGTIRLMDARIQQDHAVLLITCGNEDIVDPTMVNFETNHARDVGPDAGYLWSFSAHVIIGFDAIKAADYPVILESAPKLPRSVIQEFMSRCCRQHLARPMGADNREVWPGVIVRGEPSARLKDALESGRLTGIDLLKIRARPDKGVGDLGLEIARETLSFRPPKKKELRTTFQFHDKPSMFKRMMQHAHAKDYDLVRVNFSKNADHPDLPASLEYPTFNPDLDADEMFFTRRSSTEFKTKVGSAPTKCVSEIVDYAHGLLVDEYARRRRRPA